MAKNKKISIGNLKDVNSLKGLKFETSQFSGIPEQLEVERDDIRFREKKDYDNDGNVAQTYDYNDKVIIAGRNLKILDTIKSFEEQGNDIEMLLGTLGTIDLEYQATNDDEIQQIKDFKKYYEKTYNALSGGKSVIVVNNLDIGVYPRYVQKGRSGGFTGVKLVIESLANLELTIAERIEFGEEE